MTKEKTKKSNIYLLRSPWQENSHSVWLASTITLYRNLAQYKFPSKLDQSHKERVISVIFDELKKSSELTNPILYRSNQVRPQEKEFLLEHFMVTSNFYGAHGGEGFIVEDSGSFLGVINLENHLQLQLIDTEQDIENSWDRLVKIEHCLGKSVDYAYNPRFGFLTSRPSLSGTGLVIRLFLHIPAIIHMGELSEILEKEAEEEISATGIQGSSSEMIGDLLLAQNICTTGVTEEYLLTSLRMWATKVVVAEVSIRKKLKNEGNEHLKNKVARSLGLLTHSYQLETIEAFNALSLVKLGVELGWIEAPPSLNLNQIFFNCRRAHLMDHLGGNIEVPDLPRKRAEYLCSIFSPLNLVI
ncbi:MAG: protein arginine kinase [Chlamydiia bacterium]|nr:protein arginine kinase [Chlamydiia bacterium]